MLTGRLIFTPKSDASGRYYEFHGQGSIAGMLAGALFTEGGVTPEGHDAGVEFTLAGEAVA
jgi:hypothetical protein